MQMNNNQHHEMVKSAVKRRFRGHKRLFGKTPPRYPESAERELKRVCNVTLQLLNKAIKSHLPDILAGYRESRADGIRFDALRDAEEQARLAFLETAKELEQQLGNLGLRAAVERIARISRNTALREWKRIVRETLGIDLMDDYYSAAFYETLLRRWVDENVSRIESIPAATLGRMRGIVLEGFRQGASITTVTKAIQKEYSVTRSKARFLARDQISTLNAQLTKLQQQDAGCSHYRWSDSRDVRVRDCHRALNGKVFSWDEPPQIWRMTKRAGMMPAGRSCHPGEDYCCRCVAIPVFDIETIDLPIAEAA